MTDSKMCMVTMYCSVNMAELMKTLAEAQGISRGELMRRAILQKYPTLEVLDKSESLHKQLMSALDR